MGRNCMARRHGAKGRAETDAPASGTGQSCCWDARASKLRTMAAGHTDGSTSRAPPSAANACWTAADTGCDDPLADCKSRSNTHLAAWLTLSSGLTAVLWLQLGCEWAGCCGVQHERSLISTCDGWKAMAPCPDWRDGCREWRGLCLRA